MRKSRYLETYHCYLALPWGPDLLVGFAGWGIIVISSLILRGLRSESLDLEDGEEGALLFLSITRLATTLCAEYTWFSNCLYIPNVAVQTVHLYDKWAGLRVIPWSRDTWLSSFHWYTYKQINFYCSNHLWIKYSLNYSI